MADDAPALEDIRIASPCPASWEGMTGSDRVRHCGGCRKNVYNLSAMTRKEAERLVRETEGRLCVRFYRRADGTVLTADCPVGLRAVRRRLALLGSALAAAFLGMFAAGCGRSDGPAGGPAGGLPPTTGEAVVPVLQGKPVMGDVADPVPVTGICAPEPPR